MTATHQRTTCRGCGAPIAWHQTEAGVWTPTNPDGSPHWATCADADLFRRRAKADGGQLSLFGSGGAKR